MGSEQNRYVLPLRQSAPQLKRWRACFGGLSCFRMKKGGKRIVPASRVPEANTLSNYPNGIQVGGIPNQTAGIVVSLFAPPSSPVSFSNSALPSTAQSPCCFTSASSPGGPSSTMFVSGPYANETQLVSPPVFSTFTTEPSTAPLTPPPEVAHLTTPSSPDVPYAHFFSSSAKIKASNTSYIPSNSLQDTYSLYPENPASILRSPILRNSRNSLSSSFTGREWDHSISSPEPAFVKSESDRFLGHQSVGISKTRRDSNFFCPETFAQFYVDQSSFSHSGGRLSISRESDTHSNGGNTNQNGQHRYYKPDAEEIEAYRASFGFSADELISSTHYVEISDVSEDSFSMTTSFTPSKPVDDEQVLFTTKKTLDGERRPESFSDQRFGKADRSKNRKLLSDLSRERLLSGQVLSDEEDISSYRGGYRFGSKHHFASSNSDAEIDYRRGREGRIRRLN